MQCATRPGADIFEFRPRHNTVVTKPDAAPSVRVCLA